MYGHSHSCLCTEAAQFTVTRIPAWCGAYQIAWECRSSTPPAAGRARLSRPGQRTEVRELGLSAPRHHRAWPCVTACAQAAIARRAEQAQSFCRVGHTDRGPLSGGQQNPSLSPVFWRRQWQGRRQQYLLVRFHTNLCAAYVGASFAETSSKFAEQRAYAGLAPKSDSARAFLGQVLALQAVSEHPQSPS